MEDGGRRLKTFFSHRFSQMKHRWGLGAGHEARYLAGKAIFVRLLALTPALTPGRGPGEGERKTNFSRLINFQNTP